LVTKTLDLEDVLIPDQLGTQIAATWQSWENLRRKKITEWDEIRRYVFATDTTHTTNSNLPWKNTTTIPKLCQIRDNLIANYMSSLFPRRGWLQWEGAREQDQEKQKAIQLFMENLVSEPRVKKQLKKLVLDYIDYGNPIGSVEWVDERIATDDGDRAGFVGPVPLRISPLDIVFDPTATSFEDSPKITRALVSVGQLEALVKSFSVPEDQEETEKLLAYFKEIRNSARAGGHGGTKVSEKDDYYRVDGFDSFRAYLSSRFVEVLTFYGDLYDENTGELMKNHKITVVDRHRVIGKKVNDAIFGVPPIYHTGWRVRQDNLWAMGPLDNLVGMQYRLDHLENLKADVLDFLAAPPKKIKGYVEAFEWAPFANIDVGDTGDVEIIGPDTNILNVNLELRELEQKMEEMAGSPKESLGIRSPGEKTAFEVQRLENAASRIFQAKILQFEEELLEPLLNAMLEMARRKLDSTVVRVIDDELQAISFEDITKDDITAIGRIRPVGAKHFAEKAVQIQNISQWYQSGLGSDPEVRAHFSSFGLAKLSEDLMDIGQFKLVQPFIRLNEQANAQRIQNSNAEQVETEALTPSGLSEDDADPDELLEEELENAA